MLNTHEVTKMYQTLYLIKNKVINESDEIFEPKELTKALNNYKYKSLSIFTNIVRCTNVTNIYALKQTNPYALKIRVTASKFKILTPTEIKHLYSRARTWYQQQKRFDQDESLNYARQRNLLGSQVEDIILLSNKRIIPYNYRKNKISHSYSHFKQGRAGKTKSTFAKSDYYLKQTIASLVKTYPLRHKNRKHLRNHSSFSPVFDDNEYISARRSTGWKESTKKRKQYLIHIK